MRRLLLLAFVAPILFWLTIARDSNETVTAYQNPDKNRQAETQFVNAKELSAPGSYTHVVTVNQGKLIFVSGQVALNKQGEVVGKGDLRAQTTQLYENLKVALAVGATFADVVKVDTYVVNYKPADAAIIREIRSKYNVPERLPASTLKLKRHSCCDIL